MNDERRASGSSPDDPSSVSPEDRLPDELADELREHIAEEHKKVDVEQAAFAEAAVGTRTNMRPFWRAAVFGAALLLALFHLYTAVFGTFPSLQQGSFHLGLGLALIFLLYPAKQDMQRKDVIRGWVMTALGLGALGWMAATEITGWHAVAPAAAVLLVLQASRHLPLRIAGMPIADLLLAIGGASAGLYVFWFRDELERRAGLPTDVDISIGVIGILLTLIAVQRTIGTPLVVLAAAALLFAYHGQAMPGFFAHAGYSVDRIVATSFLGTEAVFGTPIQVSSTFIFIFLIFASLLQRTGMEKFFTQLAFGLTGWMVGGTGKVSVLTSAFAGTITGSSVANTVSNGAFTIPMMKKSGYPSEFSGGVEAASSTGGQIMPPVMGAAAFLMIEFTGLPYVEIIRAAAIPAILFFGAQFIVIHYESKKLNIGGLPRHQLPAVSALLLRKGYLLIPIGLIFWVLAAGFSPIRAAWYAVAATVVINVVVQVIAALFGRWKTVEHKLTPKNLLDALVDASRVALPIIAACASAGLIVGVITLTGIGLQLSSGLVALAGETLLLTMFFSMIACLILGIGVPTTANYVITATMAAPALLFFDAVPVIAAHMFVFYFGIMADVTPPVSLAAYAASGIARSNPLRTGLQAVKFAMSGFIVPYMFVMSPALLLFDVTFVSGSIALATALLGIFALGTAVVGYIDKPINVLLRPVLAGSGLMLLHGAWWTDLIGLGIFTGVYAWQWFTRGDKQDKSQAEPAVT